MANRFVNNVKSRKIPFDGDFYAKKDIQNIEDLNSSSGGGGEGTFDHNQLNNRDLSNQHPISAIYGLSDSINATNNALLDLSSQMNTIQSEIAFLVEEDLLTQDDIVDNTVTKDSTKVLSANQGALLAEELARVEESLTAVIHIQDDIIPTEADLPELTLEDEGNLYIVQDTGLMYLWTGTNYKQINGLTDLSNYYTKSDIDTKISGVVLTTTDQTISGTKTFNNVIRTNSIAPVASGKYIGSASAVYEGGYFNTLNIQNEPIADQQAANKIYVDKSLALAKDYTDTEVESLDIPIARKPELFEYSATPDTGYKAIDTNQITVSNLIRFIDSILILEGTSNFYYLQDNGSDYSVNDQTITINNPTLTDGMKVKISYHS